MFTDVGLVDADSIYFRIACVTKNKKQIRKGINNYVNSIRRNIACDSLLFAVKGKGNFRSDLYKQYKGNRKDLEPDLKEALNYGHQYMIEYHGAIPADGMEADDLVAIWSYEQKDMGFDGTIVGIDKDLKQIPGAHYNFVTNKHDFVTPEQGQLNLMLQCLTGDSADNIPGIKGIGPKKAEKILHGVHPDRQWNRVRAAWRQHKAGNPELSLRLLQMLTSWEEYDALRQKIEKEVQE